MLLWRFYVAGNNKTGRVFQKGAYGVLVRKPDGERPLERPRRRSEDKIKMDLQEVGWGYGLEWSGSG
jgi:hypothetical protein